MSGVDICARIERKKHKRILLYTIHMVVLGKHVGG